jgi:transposase
MLASLVATCKTSNVNPVNYIAATLRAILDGHARSRIEELMLWHFAQPSSLAAWGPAVALTVVLMWR